LKVVRSGLVVSLLETYDLFKGLAKITSNGKSLDKGMKRNYPIVVLTGRCLVYSTNPVLRLKGLDGKQHVALSRTSDLTP